MFEPLSIPEEMSQESVSLIIPVCNQASLTRECLRSIAKHTSPGSYEVIIVDNASSDETTELLGGLQGGIRVLRNPSNLGFGEACNQGARAARGTHLLFLNNDVAVRANWLSSLVATMAKDPKIGAVGSKLLFPDGRLQEAGGIIFRDGTGCNYGRGDDPRKPEYNYVREVDYCSAACLLVRREPFERLGGFDRRYAPAYYEDTHLCFELRRIGYRVLYQPASEVVHREGGTAGTDPRVGYKRYQALNRSTFCELQRDALGTQREPHADQIFLARDRGSGLRVLMVDDRVPRFDRDSGSLRRTCLLSLLAEEGHRITFLPDDPQGLSPYAEKLQQMGIEVLHRPLSIPDYLKANAARFDLIVVARAPIAIKYLPCLRMELPMAKLVFDTVDLHYLREFREASLRQEEERLCRSYTLKQTELFLGRLSSAVWVVSPTERELLLAEDPSLAVSILPNVHSIRQEVPPFEPRRDVMFIGGFQHAPNEHAVIFFVEEILPLLWKEIPDLKFFIVGSSPGPGVIRLASERVVVTGYVREPESYFDRCRVFVAPLRYGAGIKGKIGQSLANGLPVVATSLGGEGLELTAGENALLAEEPEEFAGSVLRLYRDPELWEKLSRKGRELIQSQYSPGAVRTLLRAEIASLCGRERAARPSGLEWPVR